MILRWLKNRRRQKLQQLPFSSAWLQILEHNVRAYTQLTPREQVKLCSDVQVFAYEKNWEGCGGMVINDEVKVTIAAQACLLVLGFENEYFDLVQSILVYPNAYVAPGRFITKGGVVLEGASAREGEAWYRGPVILSWADALAGGRQASGSDNLVFHEFAHQLDMQNGRETDGTPLLVNARQFERWQEVVAKEFERLQHDCRQGHPTLLDCYGATNLGEFFAVATECFFVRPHQMARRHPTLYDLLRDFYSQDPQTRS